MRVSIQSISSFLIACLVSLFAISAQPNAGSVAIVCFLSGKSVSSADPNKPLGLFQMLKANTMVRTASGGRLVLAFMTGDRYELGENSSAMVGQADLKNTKGSVRKLSSV